MATRTAARQQAQQEREQERQEEQGLSPAGVAATAAAVAALGAAQGPPKPPAANLVQEAAEHLLEAMDTLFRRRRQTFVATLTQGAEDQMPGIPPDRLNALVAEEMQREAEFQRKARMRLEADLPPALGLADPGERAQAVAKILEREKRYLIQREKAAAQRLVCSLEADLLEKASPQGAFWQLSPLIRNHCLRCLAMAGRFWPWPVLKLYRIPMHPNCGCRLRSLDEAIAAGLMTAGEVPDPRAAMTHAKMLIEQASKLEESMTHEELHELIGKLEHEVQEAGFREILRWGKGTAHGGEFRPKLGGDPGAPLKHEIDKLRALIGGAPPPHSERLGMGRSVKLRGAETLVPREQHWEEHVAGHTYTSPAGMTHIYRDGVLISSDHPDLGGPAWKPPPPEELPEGTELTGTDAQGGGAIPDYTGTPLTIGKRAGGSTGAVWAFDDKGDRWLVKTYKGDEDRIASELLANAIYRELGANVAKAGAYRFKLKGKEVTALAYPTLPGELRHIDAPSGELGAHYMTDALVANWDFIGMADDNVLWEPDGKPVRLDQGGTFQFRAQGAPKPYGPVPTEVWTMLGPRGQGFDKVDVSPGRMREQAAQIADTLTPARISELVAEAPFGNQRMAGEVEQALTDRVQWMRDFANGHEDLPQPLAGDQVAMHMREAQAKLVPWPEQHAALSKFVGDETALRRMQGSLREGRKLSIVTNEVRKRLDSLINAQRTPQDMTVYRSIDPEILGDLKELPGKVVKDKGFGTATASRISARESPGMLEILVPEGAHALYTPGIEGITPVDRHAEVLLPRNSRMRIKGVAYVGGRTIIQAVLIG